MIDVKTIDSMMKQRSDLKLQAIENNRQEKRMNTSETVVFNIVKMLGNKLSVQNAAVEVLKQRIRLQHASDDYLVALAVTARLSKSVEKRKMLQEIMNEIDAIMEDK